MKRLLVLVAAALASALVAALAAAPPAVAKDGDVLVRGTCSRASTAKLKLRGENGRIEVEFEVDQYRNGVAWRVSLQRNGVTVFAGTARTRPPSASLEVRRVVANGAGRDRVVAKAVNRTTGETCGASATFAG